MRHLKRFVESKTPSFQEMEEDVFYQRRDEMSMIGMSMYNGDMIMKHLILDSSIQKSWTSNGELEYVSIRKQWNGNTSKPGSLYLDRSNIPSNSWTGPGSVIETDDMWFWFWLWINGESIRCFKCDQLDGLFDCFKMLGIYK